jgi:hypothetical protein
MQHHRRTDTLAWNPYRGGNHSNTVAGPGQCDQRLWRDAFDRHARSNVRELAGGLELGIRGET